MRIRDKRQNKSNNESRIQHLKAERSKVIKIKDKITLKMKENEHPNIIILSKQKISDRKYRKDLHEIKKTVCIPQNFVLKFQEITNIYNQEHAVQQQEPEDDLFCDESLSDPLPPPRRHLPQFHVKNPQKHFGELPSIQERVASEQDKQAGEMSMIKTKRKSKVDQHGQITTATTSRGRINKSANDSYVRQFQSRPKTQQKKIAIDVMSLVKDRKKTKSSMSTKYPLRKH